MELIIITNQEILKIAMQQSAMDLNCKPSDFISNKNKIVISEQSDNARRYLNLPFFCNLVSYGSNIVASIDEKISEFIQGYINSSTIYSCFETPRIHLLTEEFKKYNKMLCFMAEYFLPDITNLYAIECEYEIRILKLQDGNFDSFYIDDWSNALCEKRKHLDMLAACTFDGDRIVGMAGCSSDCESMWQIGVDVLEEYRGKGIASALTSRLALEILRLGKVPFYCAAWSNVASVRNAIKSGFRPSWIELTAIEREKTEKML